MFVAELGGLVEGRPGDSELALLAWNSLADRLTQGYYEDGYLRMSLRGGSSNVLGRCFELRCPLGM